MSDIVERLRIDADEISGWGAGNEAATVCEAADTIETLRQQLAEAVDALKPFAKRADQWSLNTDHARVSVKLGDLRRARDVVERAKA